MWISRHWCIDYEELLSEIIANLLISKYPQSSPTKRKRTLKSNNQSNGAPTAEQVRGKVIDRKVDTILILPQLLSHLEYLRRSCRYGHSAGTALYLHEKMQRALQQAFSHSTEGQKVSFQPRKPSITSNIKISRTETIQRAFLIGGRGWDDSESTWHEQSWRPKATDQEGNQLE